MSFKGNLNKYLNRFRVKTGYNQKKKDRTFYKSQFKKLLISTIIVLVILLIKMIDTGVTKKTIELVDNTVNKTTSFKEEGSKIIEYARKLVGFPNKAASVFSSQEPEEDMLIKDGSDSREYQYSSPTIGSIYTKFGQEEKPNGVTIFHNGIDILADIEAVSAVEDGVVVDIGEDKIIGQYVRINHGEIEAVYGQLGEINVKLGDKVEKKQNLGSIYSGENHRNILHLEFWIENSPIDPLSRIDLKENK